MIPRRCSKNMDDEDIDTSYWRISEWSEFAVRMQ